MKLIKTMARPSAVLLLVAGILAGCASTDGGGGNVYPSQYYGADFYGSGYYHQEHEGDIIIVQPPGSRPDQNPRPMQPIANPPQTSRPSVRPMPRMPSTPRGSFRSGGGGGRR